MKKIFVLKPRYHIVAIFILFTFLVNNSCENADAFSDPLINSEYGNIELISQNKSGEQIGGNGILTEYCGEPKTAYLMCDNHKYGEVRIFNDKDFLYIKLWTYNNKKITRLNLYVGSFNEMPRLRNRYNCNKKNFYCQTDCHTSKKKKYKDCDCYKEHGCKIMPAYNKFPIKEVYKPGETEITYKIPLGEIDECVTIAARLQVYHHNNSCFDEDHDYECGNTYKNNKKRFNKFYRYSRKPRTINKSDHNCFIGRSGIKTYIYLKDNEMNECDGHNLFLEYCIQECDDGGNGGGDDDCVFQSYDTTLYAGQHINVGHITITNDETNLYVTFNTVGNWYFITTQIYVGPVDDVPRNSQGTPVPGQFPNITDHGDPQNPNDYIQSYMYTFPLADLPDCYVIAAHADTHKIINNQFVTEEDDEEEGGPQTAWSNGKSFTELWGSSRWGWVTEYCTQICEE